MTNSSIESLLAGLPEKPLFVVLNELSLTASLDRRAADQIMTDLLSVLLMLRRWRDDCALYCLTDLSAFSLAPDYPLAKWINSDRLTRDQWRLILDMQQKAPFGAEKLRECLEECEYRHGAVISNGLGCAYVLDGLAVSLHIGAPWDEASVTLEFTSLLTDAETRDFISEGEVTVRHAATLSHCEEHKAWIRGPEGRLPIKRAGRRYYHRKFRFIIECEVSGFFYSVDRTGHGGSVAKRFVEQGNFLIWEADLDAEGEAINNKHKGATGIRIPKSELG